MRIAFATPECTPWASTGGLAEAVSSLAQELARQGHEVSLYLPYYRQVAKQRPAPPVSVPSLTIPFPTYNRFARVLDGGRNDDVQTYFVDCPEFFDREAIYATTSGNYPDNAERFGLFCRTVLEASKLLGTPELFHVHDWPTALLPVMLRTVYYFDPLLRNVPVVLTIHNAGYHGWFPPSTVPTLLLPAEVYTSERLEQGGEVNLLKGGIVYADALTTVSPTYAREIQTPEFGNGLQEVLQSRSADLTGILNGAGYREWNPETDPSIAAHFSATDLTGKRECRRDLLHAFGLSGVSERTAVLGMVSRFTTQKGFDLLAEIADQLLELDVVLLIQGDGEEHYTRLLEQLATRRPAKIRVLTNFDTVMAHKIEAGSDIFLMPSRYEPCGLSQLYALRYGTIPVVRATGGLDDTIDEQPDGAGNGFKFHGYQSQDFLAAIVRALDLFSDKPSWQTMMQRAMAQRFLWNTAARAYVTVYEKAIRNRS